MELLNKKHSVGKTIATLRKEKGWTQAELAGKLRVSDKAVSKWELDDAFPSIDFFPALAELFGVSIDYLMTGKSPEKEIVIISRIELCAKNDDVVMLKDIRIDTKDEDGKTVIDYAKSYESKEVITAIIRQYGFARMVCGRSENVYTQKQFLEALYYAVWTNTLQLLENQVTNNYSGGIKGGFWINLTSLGEETLTSSTAQKLFDYLVTNEEALDAAFDVLFAKWEGDLRIRGNDLSGYTYGKAIWDSGLSYLMECAVKKNNDRVFKKCYNYIQKLNQLSTDVIEKVKKDKQLNQGSDYNNTPLQIAKRKNPLVAIRVSTIEWLLENAQVELAEELNLFNNRYHFKSVDADIIRLAKLKSAGSVDDGEMAIQAAIHHGILSVDQIVETKDLDLVQRALVTYPIHFVEILIDWYTHDQWRSMYEYAVNNNIVYTCHNRPFILAQHFVKFDKEKIAEYILNYWNDPSLEAGINDSHLYFYENGQRIQILASRYGYRLQKTKSIADITTQIQKCKKRILNDLALQLNKESTIEGLTKDYFYTQLNNGNTDIVIVKLCVRLESILKNDYRYEGDFSEMLKTYCDEKLHWKEDDGWGYMVDARDDKTIKALNSLRIQRNNIVHAEKNPCVFTLEDIHYCIEYICKMG